MLSNIYNSITSPENLFLAWNTFKADKRNKLDVARFERQLEQEIFRLYRDLKDESYRHGKYKDFWICDPKRRHIFKATVRDRVLHHAIFLILYPIFNPTFISASFSCRIGKGNHKGVTYLRDTIRKVSRNYTRPCFVLKCDIRKFFDSVDQDILLYFIKGKIKDDKTIHLIENIVKSYPINDGGGLRERERERERERAALRAGKGIPIGNLTSQLFANVYMNVFDQFVKHKLKVKYYARYTDDFVVVAETQEYLRDILAPMRAFLKERLKLDLHPDKISILKYGRGVDFLGYVVLPYHTRLRTKTKWRMLRKLRDQVWQCKRGEISETKLQSSFQSYLGVLSHADAHRMSEDLENTFWWWMSE